MLVRKVGGPGRFQSPTVSPVNALNWADAGRGAQEGSLGGPRRCATPSVTAYSAHGDTHPSLTHSPSTGGSSSAELEIRTASFKAHCLRLQSNETGFSNSLHRLNLSRRFQSNIWKKAYNPFTPFSQSPPASPPLSSLPSSNSTSPDSHFTGESQLSTYFLAWTSGAKCDYRKTQHSHWSHFHPSTINPERVLNAARQSDPHCT